MSANETMVNVELPIVAPVITVQGVILREFVWLLRPLPPSADTTAARDEAEASEALGGVGGLELLCTAHDSDLTVSLRLDRSEFVSIATEGLRMLDAADAADAEANEGR